MKLLITALFFLISIIHTFSQDLNSDFRIEDKLRIKEAFTLSMKFGNKIWRHWNEVPFTVLFVTDSNEYLINHPKPTGDFKYADYDSTLKTKIYKRPRVFQKSFLATFPAINGENTIVMGTPENTGRTSIAWVITFLHEYMHKIQYSDEDYASDVNLLDLAGGDSTGMWMLNYPFHYDNPEVAKQFSILTAAAKDAAFCSNDDFNDKFKVYFKERKKLKSLLNEKDYKYFSFQIWQEGLAMHNELKFLKVISDAGYVSNELTSLKDYVTYEEQYHKMLNNLKETAASLELNKSQRVSFYYLGALEGLILDRISYNWRDLYFTKKFYIEDYYSTW